MIDPSADIHPSAIVGQGAEIGSACRIGPYCVIGPDVRLADGVVLESHVALAGQTSIGEETRIWPFASIGSIPQDLKYAGEKTRVEIGARNMIREYVTVNPGTSGGGGVTRIGNGNLMMMHVHVAHDCDVGNGVVFANGAQVAGHVVIGNNAVLGSMAGIHQFCRVGQGAMIGGGAIVVNDVIPYGTIISPRGTLGGLNLIGLKRRGADKSAMNDLRRAYKELFSGERPLMETATILLAEEGDSPLVRDMLEFMLSSSSRSFCTPE